MTSTIRVMSTSVGSAYSLRAEEYASLFGSMVTVHPVDRELVRNWASAIEGEVLDAGCGPGQWTKFLHDLGLSASGLDQVPEFIDRARSAYPEVQFQLGSIDGLQRRNDSLAGVLSWYSLIHYDPADIQRPLAEFNRTIRPGGALLIGFFDGETVEEFDHAVAKAYRWSVDALTAELEAAGFEVLESHRRASQGQRPHAAVLAQKLAICNLT
ncbi:class I SAM-dependent methyltransferase [Psychromicrobium lacuslunae]|uniref:SAM-dependent methyltransferase n=1 Tax=Psychromicrobium lacuslunae TaxID=1618207 RepID=A0A0D4BXC5_9MICC|nr:class I SAM-dependent methyltransferase [Psychromicrobium lacuslunae]AJT41087.1 SAM-dependent methyltransferase [Psychromicrobium lacuslunae]